MRLAYFDETGDDGHPQTSSPLFALTALYLHYLDWRPVFDRIRDFRRNLRAGYGIPVKVEFHAKPFLLNKNPYRDLGLSEADRIAVVDGFCDLIATLPVKIINAVIVKPRIQSTTYNVLDWALKLVIQRIENDLDLPRHPDARFLIVTDEGRVGKMRHTARRMQQINYIPSRFGPQSYRQEIKTLIEDPLPKSSGESYFIQAADLFSFIVYLHALAETSAGRFPNRMPPAVDPAKVAGWLTKLSPVLNRRASPRDPYGIVFQPSQR